MGRNMGAECRVIGGFIMAEAGISYQLKGQLLWRAGKDAFVRFPDLPYQFL